MGFISWWKRVREESVQCEVDDLCSDYLKEKDVEEPYYLLKKRAAHQYLPKRGDDVLARKEAYVNVCSSREREFQEDYMTMVNNEYSRLKSKISRDKVQEARLQACIKWRKMISFVR